MNFSPAALSAALALTSFAATAADYPSPKQGDWIAKDFRFHSGETMPELRLHYITVGEPTGQPVLVLHGSGGSAASMLTAGFAGELFGPGQPLDASKYYIIIPDSIGHGKSSKPSDGMKTAFPKYDYEDMVDAQYRLVKEGLGALAWCGLQRVRAVRKSATAAPGERPSVNLHYESFFFERPATPLERIVLIDDVVTKGRTLLAAASRVRPVLRSRE